MDHCYPSSSSSSARFEGSLEDNNHDDDNNHNHQDDDHNPTAQMLAEVEREHMFDKVVTPSDVGKLNRLVIPKQHAEKYFPLDSDRTGSAEPAGSSPSKGLLLNFEDRTGKSWRFRYSYWNSSQSYVMTKGWSRFVKEKKLDAGDIVSFHRAGNKFFIDWRRRPRPDEGAAALLLPPPLLHFSFHRPPPSPGGGGGWFSGGGMIGPGFVVRSSHPYDRDPQYPYHPHQQQQQHQGVIWDHLRSRPMLPSVPHPHWIRTTTTTPTTTTAAANYSSSNTAQYHRQLLPPPSSSSTLQLGDHHNHMVQGEEGGGERMVYDSVPVVQGKTKAIASGKRLRLFGVNMDCPPNNSNSRDSFQLYHDDTIPALSSPSIITSGHDDHRHRMVLDDRKEEEEDDQLPLQLSLHVNKGKLSSSPSSMSLDLDM